MREEQIASAADDEGTAQTSARLAWGILGTGVIAGVFAQGLRASRTGMLVAVGSRASATARAFGERWQVAPQHCHASYADLLADTAVQAVYIATPHPQHAEWAIRAAEAGKHILCEKPLTLHAASARSVIDAARRHDVFLMEAFMYRAHPQIATLQRLLRAGAIGEVRFIQASFSFRASGDPADRLFDKALGGGGILDVGCYPVSFVRMVAGVASGDSARSFAEPTTVTGAGHIGATGVDEYAAATLTFPGISGPILAQVLAGIRVTTEHIARIFGTGGSITLTAPWTPGAEGSRLLLTRNDDAEPEVYPFPATADLYGAEADTVAAHIASRQAPAMTWDDSLGNMQTLDRWRAAVGVVYADEP